MVATVLQLLTWSLFLVVVSSVRLPTTVTRLVGSTTADCSSNSMNRDSDTRSNNDAITRFGNSDSAIDSSADSNGDSKAQIVAAKLTNTWKGWQAKIQTNKLAQKIFKKDVSSNAAVVVNDADEQFISNLDKENAEALSLLTQIYDSSKGWIFVNKKDGITVEKMYLAGGSYIRKEDAEKGYKHACVKSYGVIDASPDAVFQLFLDNTRVKEYNEHCSEIKDLIYFKSGGSNVRTESRGGYLKKVAKKCSEKWSKMTWASTPRYGPFKGRDFCSIVHYQTYKDGSYLILNRPAYHSKCPADQNFIRGTILLAGNIIEPYNNNQTMLTQIAHINPGGGVDTKAGAFIVNKLCALGPPTFIRKLEAAAKKTVVNKKFGSSFKLKELVKKPKIVASNGIANSRKTPVKGLNNRNARETFSKSNRDLLKSLLSDSTRVTTSNKFDVADTSNSRW